MWEYTICRLCLTNEQRERNSAGETWKNINECHKRFQKLLTTLWRRARSTGCSILFCLSKRIHKWKLNFRCSCLSDDDRAWFIYRDNHKQWMSILAWISKPYLNVCLLSEYTSMTDDWIESIFSLILHSLWEMIEKALHLKTVRHIINQILMSRFSVTSNKNPTQFCYDRHAQRCHQHHHRRRQQQQQQCLYLFYWFIFILIEYNTWLVRGMRGGAGELGRQIRDKRRCDAIDNKQKNK